MVGFGQGIFRRQIVWLLCGVAVLGGMGLLALRASSQTRAADPAPPATAQQPATQQPPAGIQQPTGTQPPAGPRASGPLPENPFPRRIKAPGLEGGIEWINTSGEIELEQLRGKFVLLDFWTYCCINCMHMLPELKKLEQAYPNELVVIGVHSAKFETEKDSKNITEAVMRYEIEHPVVNDANHKIWNTYQINTWPTLLLIDPEGYAVYARSGEATFEQLDPLLKAGVAYYKARGTLDTTPLHFELAAAKSRPTPLRYPGKILADAPGNRLFIADSNHNRLVVTQLDGTLLYTIGSGAIGRADGDYATASFNKPQGMFLHGETLYVADTENHLLRKINLGTKRVTTIAGTGVQGRNAWPGLEAIENRAFGSMPKMPDRWVGPPATTALNSPWALWVHGADLYIAMAGPHQIWKMPLSETEIGPYAGNGREDIVDGRLLPRQPYDKGSDLDPFSAFAQPSGLASDGQWLFVADSEGSSIRAVPFDPTGQVRTVVGTSHLPHGRLFAFGDVDGPNRQALLQHALGVVHHDGKLYVADTYNHKIKVIDLKTTECRSIAGSGKAGSGDSAAAGAAESVAEFHEPAGISYAAGKLYVADTNNHLVRTIDLGSQPPRVATLAIAGLAPPQLAEEKVALLLPGQQRTEVARQKLRRSDGQLTLSVELKLPAGHKLNPDAPMGYTLGTPALAAAAAPGAIDPALLGQRQMVKPPASKFQIVVPVATAEGEQTLEVDLLYYYCLEGAEAVCKVGSVGWSVPLEWSESAGEAAGLLETTILP